MTARRAILALILPLALAAPGLAADIQHGDLVIADAWARATPGPARTGAVYFALANHGAEPERLVAAATPVAARAELHGHTMAGAVMKMRPLESLEVVPGATVVLAPGGAHVMLIGLSRSLKEGDVLPLSLTFARAGPVELEVRVEKAGAMGPTGGGGHGHGAAPTN